MNHHRHTFRFLKTIGVLAFFAMGFAHAAGADNTSRVIDARSFIEYEKGAKDMPLTAARMRNLSIDTKIADEIFKTLKSLIIVEDFPVGQNEVKTLRLVPARPVADGQTKWVIGTKNGNKEIAAPEFTTFVGIVDDEPKSRVVLTYYKGEIVGSIERAGKEKIVIAPAEKTASGKQPHILAGEYESGVELFKNGFNCGNELSRQKVDVREKTFKKLEEDRPLNNDLLEVEVAIECDTDLFKKLGRDVNRVQQYVVSVFNMVSRIYEDEVNVTYHLPFVRIWTEENVDPFPTQSDIGISLDELTNYSISNPIDVPHHLVHMLTSPGTTGVGGIAWLDGLCSSEWGYSVSGIHGSYTYPFQGYTWDVMVITHEIGHNFGSPHTHDCVWNPPLDTCVTQEMQVWDACEESISKANPGTIMSYCHLINTGGVELNFGPRPRQVVRTGAERCLSRPVKPTVVLQSPLGKTRLVSGTQEEIRWSSSRISAVSIEYSTDKGETWLSIAENVAATARTFQWQTPTENFPEVLVRIYDVNNSGIGDTSITTFSVQKPVISLKYPRGGEKVGFKEILDITWTKDLVERARVDFSDDGGKTWKPISGLLSTNSFRWTAPQTVVENAIIRVVSAENNQLISQSAPFSINAARVQLITPNGGEEWEGGTANKIQWTSEYVRRVVLEFSLDNGQSWKRARLISVVADSGYYTWTLPDTVSTTALVRISNDLDKSVLAQSVSTFSIIDTVSTGIGDIAFKTDRVRIIAIGQSSDNPMVLVHFLMPSSDEIEISLVSSQGKSSSLFSKFEALEGENRIEFSTEGLAQGAYFLVLKSHFGEISEPIAIFR